MARPKSTPSLCVHKPSGQIYVTIDGKPVYVGPADSAEAKGKYDRTIAEWLLNGRKGTASAGRPAGAVSGLTVSEVIEAFWNHAQRYYINADGTASGELANFRRVLRPLRHLYGATPAAEFSPLCLKVVREWTLQPHNYTDQYTGKAHTRPGWCRTDVN